MAHILTQRAISYLYHTLRTPQKERTKAPWAAARVATGDPCDRPGGSFASLAIHRAGFTITGQHEPSKRHEGLAANAGPDRHRKGAGAVRGRALITEEGPEHQERQQRGRAARYGLAVGSLVESCWRCCADCRLHTTWRWLRCWPKCCPVLLLGMCCAAQGCGAPCWLSGGRLAALRDARWPLQPAPLLPLSWCDLHTLPHSGGFIGCRGGRCGAPSQRQTLIFGTSGSYARGHHVEPFTSTKTHTLPISFTSYPTAPS